MYTARAEPGTILRSGRTLALALVVVALLSSSVGATLVTPSVPTTRATGATPSAGAQLAAGAGVVTPKSSAYDWPELHDTPQLRGFASDSPLSSTNASKLGVAWATNLYGSALDSPVVGYDPALGETLAYVGTETGNVLAIDVATGQIVWGVWLGSPIRASPLLYNGSLYVGTFINPAVFRLNASSGVTVASVVAPDPFEATPTIATPPGGVPTLYFGTLDTGTTSAPFLALNAGNLSTEWEFSGYNQTAGSWDSASYAVSASGVPMVLFGTDDPDSSIYALNALTGKLLWRFETDNPGNGDWDVAAGPTISLPGANGFPQGVVYAINKISKAYALDLNNGTLIWETNFGALARITSGVSRSTAALDGTNLIFGFSKGLFNLNAKTGKLIWEYVDPSSTESIASPAIAGGHGTAVAITGDVGGDLDVVSVVGGTPELSYQTGGYITASPAVSDGNILLVSSNGFLYDFVVGGGTNPVLPTTTLTSPVQGATLANPNGNLTVSGNATDPVAVSSVRIAVQEDGPGGSWWDAATASWSPGPINNPATVVSAGATSTAWSIAIPVPKAGATFQVFANAASSDGLTDLVGAEAGFAVRYSTSGPHLEASVAYAAPGSTISVKGGGFGSLQAVNISLGGTLLGTFTTLADTGLPSHTVTIPANASFGLSAVTASSQHGADQSSVAITIANAWTGLGYSSGHDGYEPDDSVFNDLIFPGGNQWVKLAWHFDPGSAMNDSPAVVDGVAYIGDAAGQLFAVDARNGGLLWTYSLASPAAIDGSPSVDVSQGLVIVSTANGTVAALDLSNGTLRWSVHVGGVVSAPVLSGGDLFVTTTTKKAEALQESNGSVVWSRTLASASGPAPALNSTAQLAVIGESNGNVLGLNSSTGATRWNYSTGGAITAAALVSGGIVYVGSDDDSVYAINQSTGLLKWSYKTGGEIQDTPALCFSHTIAPFSLIVGSNDGNVYVFRPSTGTQVLKIPVGSAVVGVASARGVLIYETSGGSLGASRAYTNLIGWHDSPGGTLSSSPVLLDGTIYLAAANGNLYAFDTNGQPPD